MSNSGHQPIISVLLYPDLEREFAKAFEDARALEPLLSRSAFARTVIALGLQALRHKNPPAE